MPQSCAASIDDQDDDDEIMAELMAMGGDPFFLVPPDNMGTMEKEESKRKKQEADDRMSEIEAMGGDAFFLSDESPDSNLDIQNDLSSMANADRLAEIEAMGGDAFFWTDDEDDVDEEEEEEEEALSPEAFMQLVTMAGSNMGASSSNKVMNLIDSVSKSSDDTMAPPRPSFNDKSTRSTSTVEDRTRALEDEGGDPFFFDGSDENTDNEDNDFSTAEAEIEAMGGDAFFLTDDNDVEDQEEEEEEAMLPEAFMQLVTMAGSNMGAFNSNPVMNLIDSANKSSTESPSRTSFKDKSIPTMEDQMRELEEAGGDPFFFDGPDEVDVSDDEMSAEEAEIDAMGGDAFFLMDDEDEDTDRIEGKDIGNIGNSAAALEELKRFAMSGGGIAGMLQQQGAEGEFTTEEEDDEEWEWDGTVDEDAHLGFE